MKSVWTAILAAAIGLGTVVPSVAHADGENERVVSMDQIPAPARAALLREAKGTPIQRVEVETENGKTVYEGVVKQGDQKMGITVDEQGNVLGHHSETNEEKREHK
jgi:uncharacterized membrane protein YkoI